MHNTRKLIGGAALGLLLSITAVACGGGGDDSALSDEERTEAIVVLSFVLEVDEPTAECVLDGVVDVIGNEDLRKIIDNPEDTPSDEDLQAIADAVIECGVG